jgi:phospholipid/cholesterol/gamma-HCH transport system substrate-binding protein
MIFLLGGSGGFFWERYPVKTVFENIAGLKPGAPVRVAGMEVGSVTDVVFTGDRVEVVMEVNRRHRPRITSTSVASLGSVSLLGEAAVDITASSQGVPVPDWGYVPSGPTAGSLGEVATQAGEGLEQLTGLIAEVRAGQGTLGQLVTNDSLDQELSRLVGAAEGVARGLSEGEGTLGRLAKDPAAAEALTGSLENLREVTARIRAGEGSLGKLFTDDAFAESLTETTTSLGAITGRMNRGEGTVGKLVSDSELYDRLNSLSGRLDAVLAGLEQGDGPAGQLLRDRQLYENMNRTVTEMQNLVSDIRRDPKKYLNIKVSLF